MTTQNVINDVSTLLRVPNKTLEELVNKTNLCIGSIISDAMLTGEKAVLINVGIGVLSINLADMQCKFIPSKGLKTTIKKSLETQIDPVECALEQALADKLIAVCAEVI